MLPGDLLCRAAVHPRLKKAHIDQFDVDLLVQFKDYDGGRVWKLSVASRWLSRTEEGVHDFGKKVAAKGNERKLKALAVPGTMAKQVTLDTYLGYYSGYFVHIAAIRSVYYKTEVRAVNEDDDLRHFEIHLVLCDNFEPGKEKVYRGDMRTARSQLADLLFGPVKLPNPSHDAVLADLQARFLPPLTGRPFPV